MRRLKRALWLRYTVKGQMHQYRQAAFYKALAQGLAGEIDPLTALCRLVAVAEIARKDGNPELWNRMQSTPPVVIHRNTTLH